MTAYHEYDRLGRRSRTFLGGSGTTFRYSGQGRYQLQARDTISYGYDVTGRQTSLRNTFIETAKESAAPRTWRMQYDAQGRMTHRTYPGHATTEQWDYSDEGHLDAHIPATVWRVPETIVRDVLGRAVQVAYGTNRREDFAYDGAARLVASWSDVGDGEYRYDLMGNRTQEYGWEQEFDPVTHRLQVRKESQGGGCIIRFGYDAAGNQVTRDAGTAECAKSFGSDTTSYGADGRMLRRIVRRPISTGTARNIYTFRYDALGRRIEMRLDDDRAPDWGIWTYFWLDGNVAAKTRTVYQNPSDTVYAPLMAPAIGRDSLRLTGLGEWFFHAPGVDNVLASTVFTGYPDTVRIFHRDYRGSVVQVTTRRDANLPFAASAYLPFGNAAGANAGAAATNPGFNAHESGAGLVYMRNRWYDPNTGRFTQEDPIGYAGGINLYGYAGNDPVTYSDPFGLCPPKNLSEVFQCTGQMLQPAQKPLEIAGTVVTAPMAGGMGMAGQALTTLGIGARAASSGTTLARALGAAGEAASGLVKNTERIPSATGTAAFRIPDGLTASTLSEVKNVANLSLTNQIRDFAAFAQSTGRNFELFVRSNTQLSGPLQEFIKDANIILKTLP